MHNCVPTFNIFLHRTRQRYIQYSSSLYFFIFLFFLNFLPPFLLQDGTTSYFFSLEDLRRLFCGGSSPSASASPSPSRSQDKETPVSPAPQDVDRFGCDSSGSGGDSGSSSGDNSGSSSRDISGSGGGANLVEEELSFVRRQYANRRQKVARRRVWVHGKFRKPSGGPSTSTSTSREESL